jgi:acetolactate synthase-1/2/3 large subunit
MPARETVSDVFLETLYDLGVRYLFANLGTDYPPIIETLAKYKELGQPLPEVVICPHEVTAITSAHGYALATGQGQGVFVHVGVGTQNLGGALNDACAGRMPMFIFAGKTPLGTRGEHAGSRDNPIHYYQDVRDQAGILRQYVKWEFNLEAPEQAAYAFHRGLRMMHSHPRGPVYMTAAREVLGHPVAEMRSDTKDRSALPVLGPLNERDAIRLVELIGQAERPLIVTSYAGRNAGAMAALVGLSETLRVPVVEAFATYLNFPRDHANHWGYRAVEAVQEADLVLLIDTDVPWLARYGSPGRDVPVIQLDVDPIKPHITMWDFPVTESHWVDTAQVLPMLHECARGGTANKAKPKPHQDWLDSHRPQIKTPALKGKLTVDSASAVLGRLLSQDTVIFDQGVTSSDSIKRHIRRNRPGTYFGTPGSSLCWAGGAAMGFKLARPDAEVVCLIGDGSFIFGVPSSLYMAAQRYRIPFLTVIYNNGGWKAVREATESVFGTEGVAAKHEAYQHELGPTGRLEQVAGAFGCHAARAETAEELDAAVREGLAQVRQGRSSVINAMLEPA